MRSINRNTAHKITQLFDECYKRGVIDAYETRDVFKCDTFVQAIRNTPEYGLLSVDYIMTWREWRTYLINLCINRKISMLIDKVLYKIHSPTGYWYSILVFAKVFYIKGVEDYSKMPDEDRIIVFKSNKMIEWATTYKGNFRKLDANKYVQITYKKYMEMSHNDPNLPISLEDFCRSMWVSTDKLPKPDSDDNEEDI